MCTHIHTHAQVVTVTLRSGILTAGISNIETFTNLYLLFQVIIGKWLHSCQILTYFDPGIFHLCEPCCVALGLAAVHVNPQGLC